MTRDQLHLFQQFAMHLGKVRIAVSLVFFLGIIGAALSQTQPLSGHDSALVKKYLDRYEFELNVEKNIKEASRYLNETAFLFWEHNQYKQAIIYYEKSLELNNRIQNENGLAMLHNNLGMLHADDGNYEKSLDYFTKTLASRRSNKEKSGMISALINLSVVLNNLERFKQSAEGLEEALEIAREMNDPVQMRSCYGMLSETYEKAGDPEKSIYYFNLYRTFHDLIQKEEVSNLRTELREEQLVNEIERQKNLSSEEALREKQQQLSSLKNENQKFDRLIQDYDAENAAYYDSLNSKELELELLKKESEISSMELREKLDKAESRRAIERVTRIFSILIILSLSALLLFIVLSYRKTRRQAKELKLSHDNLNKTQQQLIKSEKMAAIGVLTAGIAHEINNPLNFIKNGAVALSNHVSKQMNGKADSIKPFMDIINEGVTRCSKIIVGLSHVSRTGEDMNEDCDIHGILDNCLVILGSKIKNKIEVVKKYHNGTVMVKGNEGKLHQALMNIIGNALQAMEDGGTLTLTTKTSNRRAVITIEDTGVGISVENKKKLGDPFFTTKPPGVGTGLGLYITFSIISDHKGEVDVQSEPNKYTTFELQFPLKN